MKADKENIILEMLKEMEKGSKYSQVLTVNDSKWQLSESTFSRYWRIAKERHANRVEAVNAKSDKAYIELKVKAVVDGVVKSQIERQEILSKIAGMSTELLPNLPFVIKAIAELNKMDLVFGVKTTEDDIDLIMPKIPVIE